jgi:adenylylsulfate kinase-like enzyme
MSTSTESARPEVPVVIARPGVIWITGLSGAGKTTVARATCDVIRDATGRQPVFLDGDTLRRILPETGYTRRDRLALAHTYAGLAIEFAAQGHVVVCATISLFHEVHDRNRSSVPRYLEVLLTAGLDDIRAHDLRRVYGPDGAGGPVVGIDLEPEFPVDPHVQINALRLEPTVVAERIFRAYSELADD